MATKFYQCTACGNVVVKLVDSGADLVCCGEDMMELVPSSEDMAREKHLPVVEMEKGKVRVKVGSLAHPMTPGHHISFIYLETARGGQIIHLNPSTDQPEAEFCFCCSDKVIAVYAYCNIHGLWKITIQ